MKEIKNTQILSVEELLAESPAAVRDAYQSAADALEGAALIRTMRNMAGFSKSDLARKLDVKPARVSALEKGAGRQGPTYALLKRVARVCDVDFDLGKAITPRVAKPQATSARLAQSTPATSSSGSDHGPGNEVRMAASHPMASRVKPAENMRTVVVVGVGPVKAGTVKWFNARKGYGFISPDDGSRDVEFERSNVLGARALKPGQKVTFELGRRGRMRSFQKSHNPRSESGS